MHVVTHDGTEVPLSACLVAEVHDGKISKLFEYLDSGSSGRGAVRPGGLDDEYEIRELCDDVLRRLPGRPRRRARPHHVADDCIVWHNVFGRETDHATRTSTAYPDSYTGQRRRTYNDRIVNTFDDGFVIQYTLNGVMHTGHTGALWICIVGQVPRREDHAHRRVHGLVEVRGVDGTVGDHDA